MAHGEIAALAILKRKNCSHEAHKDTKKKCAKNLQRGFTPISRLLVMENAEGWRVLDGLFQNETIFEGTEEDVAIHIRFYEGEE